MFGNAATTSLLSEEPVTVVRGVYPLPPLERRMTERRAFLWYVAGLRYLL
jgi:hypothetical protein